MIKAVIVDDENHSIETLKWKINQFCQGVEIVKTFNQPLKALEYLNANKIDLLFLDIEMPRLNGFELLSQVQNIEFDVVFTTAYDEFGIRAIKYSALDYLLKPIQPQELEDAIEKYKRKNGPGISPEQLKVLFTNIQSKNTSESKIALATKEKIEFVYPRDIIACASESNYTYVFLTENRKRIISRTLKDFEEMLKDHNFYRTHHSHLVNMTHIKEYVRTDGGYLLMEDGRTIPVSRSKKEELLNRF